MDQKQHRFENGIQTTSIFAKDESNQRGLIFPSGNGNWVEVDPKKICKDSKEIVCQYAWWQKPGLVLNNDIFVCGYEAAKGFRANFKRPAFRDKVTGAYTFPLVQVGVLKMKKPTGDDKIKYEQEGLFTIGHKNETTFIQGSDSHNFIEYSLYDPREKQGFIKRYSCLYIENKTFSPLTIKVTDENGFYSFINREVRTMHEKKNIQHYKINKGSNSSLKNPLCHVTLETSRTTRGFLVDRDYDNWQKFGDYMHLDVQVPETRTDKELKVYAPLYEVDPELYNKIQNGMYKIHGTYDCGSESVEIPIKWTLTKIDQPIIKVKRHFLTIVNHSGYIQRDSWRTYPDYKIKTELLNDKDSGYHPERTGWLLSDYPVYIKRRIEHAYGDFTNFYERIKRIKSKLNPSTVNNITIQWRPSTRFWGYQRLCQNYTIGLEPSYLWVNRRHHSLVAKPARCRSKSWKLRFLPKNIYPYTKTVSHVELLYAHTKNTQNVFSRRCLITSKMQLVRKFGDNHKKYRLCEQIMPFRKQY